MGLMTTVPADSSMPSLVPASGARRLAAFAVDYTVIAAYMAILTGVGSAARTQLRLPPPPSTASAKRRGHALSFLGLTLPVAVYFVLAESSSRQATLGKRALGLRVAAAQGGRLSRGQSLLRSALKLAPWEMAHTAIWHTPGQPFISQPGGWNMVGYGLSLAIVGWYLTAMFIGDRRAPYERVANSIVVLAE